MPYKKYPLSGCMATNRLTTFRNARITAYHVSSSPVLTRPKFKLPDLTSDVPPHYKLILYKDLNFNHKHVSRVLTEVIIDMPLTEANDKATEAYLRGRSLLRICPEDIAVGYCNDIKKNNVMVDIEPVDFF